MSELRLFIPIGKVDEAARTVYGTLTEECADKSGEVFDYASGKPAVQAWSDEISAASKGKSKGNVRAMHGATAAGKFIDIVYDDTKKRIEGAAKIIDDDEWAKVLEGVYTGFSIGGSYTKRWQDPDNPSLWRFTPQLSEISLVDNPCVPTATFEYIKADGSREMRKFTPSHKEDSMDSKAIADAREALAKGTATDEQKALIATADKAESNALLKAAQDADAKGEATDEQKALVKAAADEAAKAALVKDGKLMKPQIEPESRWLSKRALEILEAAGALEEACVKKDDARVRNLILEKQVELAPGLAEMDALLKGAKPKDDEDEDAEGDDEETKKAKKGRRDEKAAKAKEKAEKDDAEMAAKAAADELAKQAAITAAAEAAAKQEAAAKAADKSTKTVPAAKAAPVKKGLHQIGWMANLLSDLQSLQGSVEWEQMWEQDHDSELPGKFKTLVSQMCEVLVALVNEETEELIEGDDTDVVILEMSAGLPAGHPEAIAKSVRAKAEPLVKSDSKKESELGAKLVKFAEALEKAGARHSKADTDRVQALHDHAEDVHKCMGDMVDKCAGMYKAAGKAKNTAIDLGAKGDKSDPEDDDAVGKDASKMLKILEALTTEKAEKSALMEVIGKMDTTLNEAVGVMKGQKADFEKLQNEKSELAKRVAHLEGQPAPAKGSLRAFSKTQDSGGADGETDAEFKARLEKLSPDQKTIELIKVARRNSIAG